MKGTDLESTQKFFKKELSSDEWIIITPSSKGEELINNLKIMSILTHFLFIVGILKFIKIG